MTKKVESRHSLVLFVLRSSDRQVYYKCLHCAKDLECNQCWRNTAHIQQYTCWHVVPNSSIIFTKGNLTLRLPSSGMRIVTNMVSCWMDRNICELCWTWLNTLFKCVSLLVGEMGQHIHEHERARWQCIGRCSWTLWQLTVENQWTRKWNALSFKAPKLQHWRCVKWLVRRGSVSQPCVTETTEGLQEKVFEEPDKHLFFDLVKSLPSKRGHVESCVHSMLHV